MKKLRKHTFNATNCRTEWNDFYKLLSSKSTLDEAKDVLPFFKVHHDLSTLISRYFPKIRSADRFAHEYPIYGDFRADLVIGDSTTHNFVLVEFEDGNPESIFKKKTKATPEWAPRFENAFSQLLDWLWKLEDMRSTGDFENTFGSRQAKFQGLIVIGKDMNLEPQEKSRLEWRTERVIVDSNAISCVSFDDLLSDFDFWLREYHGV